MEEILHKDDILQSYLLSNHYSFVGPENQNFLESFIKTVNNLAPANMFGTIHTVLSDRKLTRKALDYLPQNSPLRIYIIIPNNTQILKQFTLQEYCTNNNFTLPNY